jgi:hypothetical protein
VLCWWIVYLLLDLNQRHITATNKVIGTVAGLEYTYSSQTLIISKTSGTFAAEDVVKVVESIKLKNTDTDSQLGIRIVTITYIDSADDFVGCGNITP